MHSRNLKLMYMCECVCAWIIRQLFFQCIRTKLACLLTSVDCVVCKSRRVSTFTAKGDGVSGRVFLAAQGYGFELIELGDIRGRVLLGCRRKLSTGTNNNSNNNLEYIYIYISH